MYLFWKLRFQSTSIIVKIPLASLWQAVIGHTSVRADEDSILIGLTKVPIAFQLVMPVLQLVTLTFQENIPVGHMKVFIRNLGLLNFTYSVNNKTFIYFLPAYVR